MGRDELCDGKKQDTKILKIKKYNDKSEIRIKCVVTLRDRQSHDVI